MHKRRDAYGCLTREIMAEDNISERHVETNVCIGDLTCTRDLMLCQLSQTASAKLVRDKTSVARKLRQS